MKKLFAAFVMSLILLYATLELVRYLVNQIYAIPPKKHNVTRLTI